MNNFRSIRYCVYYLGTIGQKNLRFYVRRNTFDIVDVKCRLSHTPMTYDDKITPRFTTLSQKASVHIWCATAVLNRFSTELTNRLTSLKLPVLLKSKLLILDLTAQ